MDRGAPNRQEAYDAVIRVRSASHRGAVAAAVAGLVCVGAACASSGDAQGIESLPPIFTTTTTSTSTTLVDSTIELYTVKPGENLSLIARSFEVPLAFLIEENQDQIDDPNNVPPGVTLRIPPYRIVDELPVPSTTEEP